MREQPAAFSGPGFYDRIYRKTKARVASQRLSVMSAAAELINGGSVLDVGCGNGHMATEDYLGIDYSPVAIKEARRNKPNADFILGDIFDYEYLLSRYDTVLLLEILEHLEDDLALLELIPADTKVVISVPTFLGGSHVRAFDDCEDVVNRYGDYVTADVIEQKGKWFLMAGRRR
jgi:2-polyprenyl-3-methyl-5-hydroxy-6-metoxy-1,4-benzoquinol methylase